MAKREIEYNLTALVELQDTILQILKDRGDVEVPATACLGSVPSLIQDLSNKSYVSMPVQTEIARCGKLITRFAVFSDVHCASPFLKPDEYKENNGYINGTAAIREYAREAMNGELDFVVFTGDSYGPEGGSADVYGGLSQIWDEWRSILAPTGLPLYAIPGNHDSGCDVEVWHRVSGIGEHDNLHFMDNNKTCYYTEINGDLYIWFALFNNKMFNYTDAHFDWLFNLLDANKDRTRVFLFSHWYDGTVDGFGWRCLNGKYINHGWHEDDNERFGQIKEYKNVIWISGHAHTDWKYEDTYPNIKVHSHNTARMVNVPSMLDNNQDVRISVYNNMVVVEPYSKNQRLNTRIYYIGNGETENVMKVNYYLTGVESSNNKASVSEGGKFTTTLSLKPHYSNMSVSVYMGGVDITSSCYNSSTGVINIPSVTGIVDITAKAISTAKTYNVHYTLSGYKSNNFEEFVENTPFNIVLTPNDGFDSNPDSITISITGLGTVVLNGYEDSDYIDIQTVNNVTTVYFTSEMAIGDVYVSAQASKTVNITYDLAEGVIIDNDATTLEYGEAYVAHISLEDGSTPDVQILVSGVDLTSNFYKDGVINIPSVSQDIVIKVMNLDSKYVDYVKMVFDVNDTSKATKILYPSYNVGSYITDMVVDGNQIDNAVSYQFDTVGKHTVYCKLASQELHSNFANGCADLVYAKIPIAVKKYSSALFRDCSNLEEVDFDCYSSLGLTTYIVYNTPNLKKLTFRPNITNIAQNNINVSSLEEVYIYNTTEFKWYAGSCNNEGICHYVDGADISTVKSKLPNFTFVADL